ncbi:MAG: putative Na+/H+ antiporter [Bdellovibrionales bacterium]|jgi:predicted cation transporter|nr:putative Na+/H+ antiporter [Bdellovibrionales bacterium]
MEKVATLCFGLAVLHTFLVKRFQHLALKFKEGSVAENLFHLLGEVEIVFGFWSGIFLIWISLLEGKDFAIKYLEGRNFVEPAFVFVIMAVCSTKPILSLARNLIDVISRGLPLNRGISFFVVTLVVGPLLGSFITEPAAMTITAILLLEKFYQNKISMKLKYATLGLLFVNISVGGTLTPFAAPPVLMVAAKWDWDFNFMITHFGWRALCTVLISTGLIAFRFRNELREIPTNSRAVRETTPIWISALHLLFLAGIVSTAHHLSVFVLIFLFFLGLTSVTKEYQNELKIKDGLLVAFFLAGLVILGGPQGWWLEPVLSSLGTTSLYLGAMGLTAVTDNAALTYLGSQVPNLSDLSKYALVAGSVVGGGLTVIANAPNPAGYGLLNASFGDEGISPLGLFAAALLPTLVAAFCFWPFF